MVLTEKPLFWTNNYWAASSSARGLRSRANHNDTDSIHLERVDGRVFVPGSATFGGWWPAESCNRDANYYVRLFTLLFEQFDETSWKISLPPAYFFPDIFAPQSEALLRLGGTLVNDVGSVTKRTAGDADGDGPIMSKGKKQRIRAFARDGGDIREARLAEWKEAYEVLRENRERRGVELSMSQSEFEGSLRASPNDYKCWVAVLGNEICGAALTVEISAKATYVFYWGDSITGRKANAVTAIYGFLFKRLWNDGKEFLDLGKSSVEGVVDENLLNFKAELGAEAISQPTFSFTKKFAPGFPAEFEPERPHLTVISI